jgi:hypothetical protein
MWVVLTNHIKVSTRQTLRRSTCVWASPILHKYHATVFTCDTGVMRLLVERENKW